MIFILICIVGSHFCFMCLVVFIIHFLDWDFVWVLLGKNIFNFQKTKVKKNFSFPPLKMNSLELERLVEISNYIISFFFGTCSMIDLLKIVGENTKKNYILLINNAKEMRYK